MSETLEYIDLYFTGNLSASEKTDFERRCESDPDFAQEVAFYISARAALKDNLLEEKKKEFNKLHKELSAQQPSQGILRKLYPLVAAAAACLVLFIGYQLFFKDNSSKDQQATRLANEYIEKNMQKLSITMGGDNNDSLALGVAAFNKQEYKKAEEIFGVLSAKKNNNSEAIKYLGIVYLVNEDYDKAIVQFDSLAQQTNLYANPGLFYKAVTLMKRSAGDDNKKAKLILEEVIKKNLPGNKEATGWINKM